MKTRHPVFTLAFALLSLVSLVGASTLVACNAFSGGLISDKDTVVVGWNELGVIPQCDVEAPAGVVRIDFPAGTVTRIHKVYRCGSGAAPGTRPSGAYEEKDGRTVTMTADQKAQLLESAEGVELRTIDECLGHDGRSYFIDVAGGGSYTDGISFGCDTIAVGHASLYSDASALVP